VPVETARSGSSSTAKASPLPAARSSGWCGCLGFQGIRRGRVVRTTVSDARAPCIPPAEAEANYYRQLASMVVAW